jgi:hypothetical protein
MSVGLAILIIAAVWLTIAYPGFRKLAVVSLGAACLGFVVFAIWVNADAKKRNLEWEQQQAANKRFEATAISPSDLTITDVSFAPSWGPIQNDVNVKGIVANHSKYQLSQLSLDITAIDCPAYFEHLQYSQVASHSSECRIIGEQQGTAEVDSPGGQTRAFQITVNFNGMPPANRYYSRRYNFRVTGVKATQ